MDKSRLIRLVKNLRSLGKSHRRRKKYIKKYWVVTRIEWRLMFTYIKYYYKFDFSNVDEYLSSRKNKWKTLKTVKKNPKSDKKLEYTKYLKSSKWKERRQCRLEQCNYKCSICNLIKLEKHLHLHHHTYDNLYNEKDLDLDIVCQLCHKDIHYVNWKRTRMNENSLRKRFNELKEERFDKVEPTNKNSVIKDKTNIEKGQYQYF